VDAGKTVIITGGGYGIGRAITQTLAASGWSVVIYDRHRERARATQATVQEAGGQCTVVVGDVTSAPEVERAVDETLRTYGRLNALVNNAAMRHVGTILDISEAQWDETVAVVLKGPFLFSKAVIPHFIAAGGGAIVNISSPDAFGRRAMIPYAAAKGALNTLTLCLAADHLEHRIRVNAVLPGFTLTGMTEHYSQERIAEIAAHSVAGRAGRPEDVAAIVRFLLSDAAATLTGGIYGGLPLAQR